MSFHVEGMGENVVGESWLCYRERGKALLLPYRGQSFTFSGETGGKVHSRSSYAEGSCDLIMPREERGGQGFLCWGGRWGSRRGKKVREKRK